MCVRFYIKCVDKQGVVSTLRFTQIEQVLGFVAQSSALELAIVDTHMAFYEMPLLAPMFGVEVGEIDHMDINLAKDGSQYAKDMPSNKATDDDNQSDGNQVMIKKSKKDKPLSHKNTKDKSKISKKLKKKSKNDKAKKHKAKTKKKK